MHKLWARFKHGDRLIPILKDTALTIIYPPTPEEIFFPLFSSEATL